MLRERRFDEERTVAERRVRPVDRRCADVALGGRDLRIHALRARCAASATLTASRALRSGCPGAPTLPLLRIQRDGCRAHRDDGHRDHRLHPSLMHPENLTSVAPFVRRRRLLRTAAREALARDTSPAPARRAEEDDPPEDPLDPPEEAAPTGPVGVGSASRGRTRV